MAIPNKSPLKILEKMERGRINGLCKFFGYPILSQERVKLRTSNLASTFIGPIPFKAHEKFWRKGSVGVSRGCPIFWVPLLSQERVKLRTSKYVGTFTVSIGTKAHEKMGIVAVGVVRESRNFSGHPLIGRIARSSLRLHGHFCDCTAFT